MAQRVRVMLSVAVALGLTLGGLWLARPELAWAWTAYQDSGEAYQRYAERWPASRHLTEALARQDARDWQRASASRSIPELHAYLDQHPTGAYVGQARQAEDDLRWQEAESAGSIYELGRYLFEHPTGLHAATA